MDWINMDALNGFLTESISGIILLGAMGSVLGAIFIWIFQKILSHSPEMKDWHRTFISSFIHVEIEISEQVKEMLLSKDKQVAFLTYNADLLQKINHCFILLLVEMALTVSTYATVAIDKPLLLSLMIALVILQTCRYIKLMFRYKLYTNYLGFESLERNARKKTSELNKRAIQRAKMLSKYKQNGK